MTKRLLAALLCAILVMALLPATALATTYDSWDAAMASLTSLATDTDTITIGGSIYTYGGDISSAGLTNSWALNAPKILTVYKAGDGKVLWEPELNGSGFLKSGTLTFDGTTIAVDTDSGAAAVTLPNIDGGVKVVFKGANSITANNKAETAIVFICTGSTTFDLTGGSDTVLNAGNGVESISKGIYLSSPILDHSLEITGSGKLTVNATGTNISSPIVANTTSEESHPVKLTGGTLVFSGSVICNVTLGGVTIPADTELHLERANSVTKGTSGAVNNGILVLKQTAATSTDIAAIKALGLTGSGMVKVGDNYYTNKGETIHKYVSLDFANLEYTKDAEREPKKFESDHDLNDYGFEIEGDKESGYIITLGNLLIEPNGEIEPNAIILPDDGNVTVYLTDGATTRITTPNGSGISIASSDDVCTIAGTGKLEIQVSTGKGAIRVPRLIIEGGDITINNNSENGYGIDAYSSYAENTDKTVNITGGRLKITAKNAAIAARDDIIIGSGMHITSPSGATPGSYAYEDTAGSDSSLEYITILIKESVNGETVDKVVTSVIIEPAPSSGGGGGGDYTPSPVTVYNDPSQPKATVWLSGNGLSSSDLLITERDPQGSAYKALLKLADSDDVFNTYNIYLRSGKKSTGSAMNLTFDLNAQYAGNDFTLVHQKADNTFEYFYDTADANGDLTFGPLYELSPFMLVKGRLAQTAFTSLTDAPKTGDSAQTVLYTGAALIMAAALAGLALRKQKRN